MDVTLPDGTVVTGVPEGTTKAQLAEKLRANGKTVPDEWLETKKRTPMQMVGRTISNIPGSAVEAGKNIASAVMHPIETGKAVLNVAAGGAQKLLAPESFKQSGDPFLYSPQAEQAYSGAEQFFKKRYGGAENVLETVQTDPVGVAMDLSALSGMAGKAAQAGGAARTGTALSKIGEMTNPVALAGKGALKVAKPAYEYGLGMTTGAGATAIKEALKGGDAFTQAMRGKISETDVLDSARSALQGMKAERGDVYRAQLAGIKAVNKNLDISGVKNDAREWLTRYGIKETKQGLDFSRSTLRANPAAAKEVEDVYKVIKEWGNKKGDRTPAGLDTLKRIVQDSFTSQNPSRAMVTDLKKKIHSRIASEVPEYEKMTRDYAQASDMIDDITKGLSLGDKAATDTALRKLSTAIKEDAGFRRGLIQKLDAQGKDVSGAVSGLLMKNPWSNRIGPLTHSYGVGLAAYLTHNPTLAAMLPLASPRLVGEMSRALGKLGPELTDIDTQAMFQAGRINENVPLSEIKNERPANR